MDFTRSFAVMVRARLSLVEALETAAAQCAHARLQATLRAVLRDVRRGRSLSASLSRHETVFSRLYVHLAEVGEAAGVLDAVLLRLAAHLEKAEAVKRKVTFALFYPGLVLTVAAGAVVFFLTTIVPTFAEMYMDFGQQLPGPTRVVLRLSAVFTEYALLVLPVLALGVLGVQAGLRTPAGRRGWDRWKLRLPLVGRLLRKSLTARFCRTLGTLLSSGVALAEGLDILSKSLGNRHAEAQFATVLRRVRRGSTLSQPLQEARLFPGMVVQLVAVGEATSELDAMLLHAAAHYEAEVDALLDGLTAVIEPILIVVIGLLLGSILVALYLPMFELVTTVG